MAMGTLGSKKPYAVEGFPAPVSSGGAWVLLWDGYKTDPKLSRHVVDVHGVEPWPCGIVHAFRDSRPGKESVTGRPKGRMNAVPVANSAHGLPR